MKPSHWVCMLAPVFAVYPAWAEGEQATPSEVRHAIRRGLAIVQRGAANYPKRRRCFSCHHQTLPVLAMVTAKQAGLPVDDQLVKEQAMFSLASFRKRIEDLQKGENIGGQAMTVGYGLWTLDLARVPRDETTDAMVTFLLKTQSADGRWRLHANRPPLESSEVTNSVLAVQFLRKYARPEQQDRVDQAADKAHKWLVNTRIESQEDVNSWVSGHALFATDRSEAVREGYDRIVGRQNRDGGWSQLPEMASDAYATGQTIFVLRRMQIPAKDSAVQRGITFLLRTQREDGSWFVKTRSEPIQVFFDNGDPHGEHQFISITATGWAVTALALAYDGNEYPADQPSREYGRVDPDASNETTRN